LSKQDLNPYFLFSSKGGTLKSLQGHLKQSQILPLVLFTVNDWQTNRENCIKEISLVLGSGPFIVRSSSNQEDKETASRAGMFKTLKNVNQQSLVDSVEQVIASYKSPSLSDEVLVQRMLTDTSISGVAFSHDPNSCAPVRVINLSFSDDTSQVTSGAGGSLFHHSAESPVEAQDEIKPIIAMIDELLQLFHGTPIDCEFAFTARKDGKDTLDLWLLQVRRLLLSSIPESEDANSRRLNQISNHVRGLMRPDPFLLGKTTIFGVMPDWNPAEILGTRPKALALSLYQDLITESIWAYQRNNYGYRDLRSFPLMQEFFGLPYIDSRVSFNSFVPADLDESIASRLVDHYLDCLKSSPNLHDKIEFEIVFANYTFDLPEKIETLKNHGFIKTERKKILASLLTLTKNITDSDSGLWRKDLERLERLDERRHKLIDGTPDKVSLVYWLIEDTKRYGTLPFAGLARAAFISISILKSLVTTGIFSQTDFDKFLLSIATVTKQMSIDRNTKNPEEFLKIYGHLRPGTYEITSKRYDEAPDIYFDWTRTNKMSQEITDYEPTSDQISKIASAQELHGFKPNPYGLLKFLKSSIELRELSKFKFTKNLSEVLSTITHIGETFGFSREDMAYCDIRTIKDLYFKLSDPKDSIKMSIERNRSAYAETEKLSLPPLISSPNDVWSFKWTDSEPNYVTQNEVTAKVASFLSRKSIANKIVLIPNADPGFDWIFECGIVGLITAWGGANSHMAIRASEIGLPAVIGIGEKLFSKLSSSNTLFIDCRGRRIVELS